jgi:hypothetical protein
VKRILTVLAVGLVMVAVVVAMSMPAFARITQENRGGNEPGGEARGIPATNPADKCPPGQNKDLSEGAQKKCERLQQQ